MGIPCGGTYGDFVTLMVTQQIKQRSDFIGECECTHAVGDMQGGALMCTNTHVVYNDTCSKKQIRLVAQIRYPITCVNTLRAL